MIDVLLLECQSVRPYKLSRSGAFLSVLLPKMGGVVGRV